MESDESRTKSPTPVELSESNKKEIFSMLEAMHEQSFYSGPIPSPEVMQKFKDVMEDAPDRIFTMAEKSQAHNHAMSHKLVQAETRAQNFAFTFSLIALIATVICVYMKQPYVAGVLGSTTIVMVVRYFMGGALFRSKTKKEEDDDPLESHSN